MADNGEDHDRGTCDNCGKSGKSGRLGFVVGKPDGSHLHSCPDVECRAALEAR